MIHDRIVWNFSYYKDIKVKFEDEGKVHRKHNKHSFNQPQVNRVMFTDIATSLIWTNLFFLGAESRSRSYHVTSFVRSKCFFDFAFTSLLGQDLWHWWSLKWPRTTVKVSYVLLKKMCWSLKLKYEILIEPLHLKFDIECFAFYFWCLKLAFKSEG